eukprot:s295_g11.t1
MVGGMTSHALPPSPLLSPGRQLCGVPQSPILTYRSGLQPVPSPVLYARHTKSTSDLSQGVYIPDMRMRTPAPHSGMPVTILPQARAYSPVSNRGSPAPVSPHGGHFRSVVSSRTVVQVSRSPSPTIGRTSPMVIWRQTASAVAPAGCLGRQARSPPRQAAVARHPVQPGVSAERCQAGAPSSLAAPPPWALRDAPSAGAWKGSLTSRAVPVAKTEVSVVQEPRTALSPLSTRSPIRTACTQGCAVAARKMSPKSVTMSQEALRQPAPPVPPVPAVPAAALSMTLPVDGREAQVAHVRESLLKHIHSVQQEIARLQDERQKMPSASKVPEMTQGEAACRLQHWWRSRRAKKEGPSQRTRLRPRHFAAARIQRWFRLYRWRRRFVDISVHQIGWLGSLAWLQEQNLLYGTELADKEDVRWWSEQRAAAPLDREVDPWGALKLREHLDKMWYGHTNENSAKEEELLLLHHHQKLIYQEQKQKKLPQPQPPRPPARPHRPQPKPLLKKPTWHVASTQSLHAPAGVPVEPMLSKSRIAGAECPPAVKITQRGWSTYLPGIKTGPDQFLVLGCNLHVVFEFVLISAEGKQSAQSVRNYPPRVPTTLGASAALPATRPKSPLTRPGASWAPTMIQSASRTSVLAGAVNTADAKPKATFMPVSRSAAAIAVDPSSLESSQDPKVLKAYTVFEDPRITVIPNFLSDSEMQHLLDLAAAYWVPSTVGSGVYKTNDESKDLQNKQSKTRTSYSCMLRSGQTETVQMIEQKLARLAGLEVKFLERLNMVRYAPGQLFNRHHDGRFRPKTGTCRHVFELAPVSSPDHGAPWRAISCSRPSNRDISQGPVLAP